MFTAELEGAEQLAHDWVNVRAAVRAGMRRGVSLGTREGADEARHKHPFKNRTGNLERSIAGRVTGSSSDEHRGEIVAGAKYASFVENGTRPHEIRPKRAGGVLRFVASDGAVVLTRRVMHPGTTALPFMGIAYLKCERVMIREIEVGVARAQRILDG